MPTVTDWKHGGEYICQGVRCKVAPDGHTIIILDDDYRRLFESDGAKMSLLRNPRGEIPQKVIGALIASIPKQQTG